MRPDRGYEGHDGDGDGGVFIAVVTPRKNTVYTVKVKNTTSNALAGKYATFQRYSGTLQRWVNVKRVLLRANSTGVAPTVISSVTFRSSVRARRKIRVVLPQRQVGTCYVAGRSNVILS